MLIYQDTDNVKPIDAVTVTQGYRDVHLEKQAGSISNASKPSQEYWRLGNQSSLPVNASLQGWYDGTEPRDKSDMPRPRLSLYVKDDQLDRMRVVCSVTSWHMYLIVILFYAIYRNSISTILL